MEKLKNKKIYIFLVIIFIIGILLICTAKQGKTKQKFITKKIERCTITEIVEASGTINPVNTVSVGSTVSGLIKEIYADYNSEVKKGQVLAQIDPANFEDAVKQNQASINSAQADLARLQAIADLDKKTLGRYERLYAKNFIAKSELDQAQSTYAADMAQITAAKAKISQAQAQYKTALTNLSYTKIISPVDGTVISREIDLGQPVAASFQAPELFKIAQDLKKMQIEVNVSEADIGKIKAGQDVIYTLDGYQDSEFEGKVTQVRISPTTVSNVVTYSVIVDVNNDDLKLKPGMTANVSIITQKSEDVLCVPNIALKVALDKEKKYETQGVWVLKKNKPIRVDLEIGSTNDNFFEAKNTELQEGDEIIVKTGTLQNMKQGRGGRPPMM